MFLGKTTALISLTALCFAGVAMAQESSTVGSSKVATKLPDLVSSQTGNLQLRSYLFERHEASDRSERAETEVVTQARGNLTVKTFKDKVSTTLTLAASNFSSKEGVITQRRPRLLTEVTAVDSSYFGLVPYLELYGPQTAPGTRGDLGLRPTLKHPAIVTAIGDLNFALSVEAEGQFNSREEDSKVRTSASEEDARSFGLSGESGAYTKKDEKGLTYEVWYVPEVTLNMDRVVKGLTVLSYAEYINTYNPVIEVGTDGSEKRVYEPQRDVTTYVGASYKITDALTLDDQVSFGYSKFYEARGDRDRNRVVNLAMLTYKMY